MRQRMRYLVLFLVLFALVAWVVGPRKLELAGYWIYVLVMGTLLG